MTSFALSADQLAEWNEAFHTEPKNLFAQNVCTSSNPFNACLSTARKIATEHQKDEDKLNPNEPEVKPTAKPKKPGKCWLFVALNCISKPVAKKLQVIKFEFSQAHFYFWDKLERCNYFLNDVVNTAKRGEPLDGRLVRYLMKNPLRGGGHWDMVVNLIQKYGLMPKDSFPHAYNFDNCLHMNAMLKSKLREYAKILLDLNADGAGDDMITEVIYEKMSEIYRILGICLGIPPQTFTWEYKDTSKNVCRIGPLTPLEFYHEHVKPVYNVEDKVCLVSDPRPTLSFNSLYTVDCLGNIVGGRRVLYNNQRPEVLLDIVTRSLKNNRNVWFGAEIKKLFRSVKAVEDTDKYNFSLLFNFDDEAGLSKADRRTYRDSMVIHPMVLTALLGKDEDGPVRFRMENCLAGDTSHVVTADWFVEHVFHVVVDKSLVSEETLGVFEKEATLVPGWDPLGVLLQ